MTSEQERVEALCLLLGVDKTALKALLKEWRKTQPGLGVDLKAAGDVRMALKQAQPAGPLDAALDRLRAALEAARQTRGDQELVKLVDSFTATLKPAAGRRAPGHLRDTDKPEAERTKAAGPLPLGDLFDAVFDGTPPSTFRGENWS